MADRDSSLSSPQRAYQNPNHSTRSFGLSGYPHGDSRASLSLANLTLSPAPHSPPAADDLLEGNQTGNALEATNAASSFVEFDFAAGKTNEYVMTYGERPQTRQPPRQEAEPSLPAPLTPTPIIQPNLNPEDDAFFGGGGEEGFSTTGEWKDIQTVTTNTFFDDRGAAAFGDVRAEPLEAERHKAALRGYTRIDAEEQATKYSALNAKTDFLFLLEKLSEGTADSDTDFDEDETYAAPSTSLSANETPAEQLLNTKAMLLDVEKIAYVGLVNLTMIDMATDLAKICTRSTRPKTARKLALSQAHFAGVYQRVMDQLYAHMDLSKEEQAMIERLSVHGITPMDICGALVSLTPKVVANPIYEEGPEAVLPGVLLQSNPQRDISPIGTGVPLEPTTKTGEPLHRAKEEDDSLTQGESTPSISKALRSTGDLPQGESTQGSINTPKSNPSAAPPPEAASTLLLGAAENAQPLRFQKTLSIDLKWTLMCDLFLLLVSNQVYDARCRTLLFKVGTHLGLTELELCLFERKVTDAVEVNNSTGEEQLDEKDLVARRSRLDKRKRAVYIGLATIGGGLVIGLSAGLLAPVIGAGIAAGLTGMGVAGTAGFLTGVGGTAIVTSTGVIAGARVGSRGMAKRVGSVKTFEFKPLHHNQRTNLIITVSGWMNSASDDVRLPFSTVDPVMGDLFSLLWEPEMLTSMGQTIGILATEALTQSIQQILGSTILIGLMASIQLPMALSKLGYLLDNPWNVSLDRAHSAGLILADTLMARNLGLRPVTLVGFSLGAKLIYTCLRELAKRGAYGLVESVYLFGAPVASQPDQLCLARSVVSGRFVNGYSKKDWILGYLFRATGGGLRSVAGLSPIELVHGIENFDCTEFVEGHMAYRKVMPLLMSKVGWEVLSVEFVEIDGPDPEQQERQRKLVVEFEEAKDKMNAELAAKKRKKKGWKTWFIPKKKEWWEIYEEGRQELERKQAEGKVTTEVDLDVRPADVFAESGVDEYMVKTTEQKETPPVEGSSTLMRLPSPEGRANRLVSDQDSKILEAARLPGGAPEVTMKVLEEPSMSFPEEPSMSFPEEPSMSFPEEPSMSSPGAPTMSFPEEPTLLFPGAPTMSFSPEAILSLPRLTFETPPTSLPHTTQLVPTGPLEVPQAVTQSLALPVVAKPMATLAEPHRVFKATPKTSSNPWDTEIKPPTSEVTMSFF